MCSQLHNSTSSPDSCKTPEVSASPTIVAVATPPGQGGISIVRLSGAGTAKIIIALSDKLPEPRYATLTSFKGAGGRVIDQGLMLYFPAPASYTGEDVAELHGHGSPVVMQMLVRRCLQLGARMARPGEFSERAFLNGRLDLAQAEAVADLIASHTEAAARSAMNSLTGEFSNQIAALITTLTALRVEIEATIDFPEEDVSHHVQAKILQRCCTLQHRFKQLTMTARQGQILRDGLKVVLTGPPNAGKSSLLNALSQVERAIVSPHAGTTRDVLQQQIQIDGLPIEIIDTAGLRDANDEIEAEGVRRAEQAQREADLVLLIVDDAHTSQQQSKMLIKNIKYSVPTWLVRNKIDLSGQAAFCKDGQVCISATTGQGLTQLRQALQQLAGFRGQENSCFIARQRHLDALQRAQKYLDNGIDQYKNLNAIELLAEELYCAQLAVGEITGQVTSDDLLGLIFSSFCIGK